MTFEEYKKQLFETALSMGCSAAEVYYVGGDSFEVNILEGEIEKYSVSRQNGLNLRVKYDGKDGYAYTEVFDDAKNLVSHAIDNAKVIESEDDHPMQGKSEYPQVPQSENPTKDFTAEDKIAHAKKMETITKAMDKRVQRLGYCDFVTGTSTVAISNTLGLDAKRTSDLNIIFTEPIMKQGEEVKDGIAFAVGKDVLNLEAVAKEAIDECARQFGASPVPSGEYKCIIRNKAISDLLAAFSSIFSADEAQKGLSLLADKQGEMIASDCVTIVDDPIHEFSPKAFDDEGVPCFKKNVVENGKLTTLLHNLKTAKKAGCASTGNGGRASATSAIGVSPTNFYIVPGKKSYDELVKEMGDGIIITDLSGLHAGLNTVSGEFSLLTQGLLVEGGKVTRSVEQITSAGSFFDLLKNITDVGSDFRFNSMGDDFAAFGAPSVLVSKLVISG